mmetsp:Transcript_2290/g.6383  ORF Transcript_2290/g.6383 Transcript_2290/m.6383 type:complete len:244 (-) Transcript_2290:196-927(-)
MRTTSSLPRCADAIMPSAKPLFNAACAAALLRGLGASSRCTTTDDSRFFFFLGRGAAFVAAMAPPRFFFLAAGFFGGATFRFLVGSTYGTPSRSARALRSASGTELRTSYSSKSSSSPASAPSKYLMRYSGAGLPRVSSKSDSAADNQPTTFAWACSLMPPSTPITERTKSKPINTDPSVRQGASEAMAASFECCAATASCSRRMLVWESAVRFAATAHAIARRRGRSVPAVRVALCWAVAPV